MTNTPTAKDSPGSVTRTESRNWWPTAIVLALLVVVALNAAFIWIAVSGQDPVVPSYSAEAR
jgi:hypothetical protein